MKYLVFLSVFICVLDSRMAIAQRELNYPSAQELRTLLLKLVVSRNNAFQDLKGSPLNKKGTTQYYKGTLHIVPNDTPKIAKDTNPLQVYYLDFLTKGLTEDASATAFRRWQDLILAALPGYTMSNAGNQYPDLESKDFRNPESPARFTLYRNKDGAFWQISIAIVNSDLNSLLASVTNTKKDALVGQSVAADTKISSVPKGPSKVNQNKTGAKREEEAPPTAEQIIMQSTINKLLMARLNNFQAVKDVVIKSSAGIPKFTVKGTKYPN